MSPEKPCPPRVTRSRGRKPAKPEVSKPTPAPPKPTKPVRPTPGPRLLNDIVADINGLYIRGALETALAVASLVVERLLGGDDRRLAQRAVRGDLNKRELQEAVTRWRTKHKLPPVGRPPEDPAVTASRRMATAALRLSQAVQQRRPTGHAREDVLCKLELTEKRIRRVKKTLGVAD